MYGNPNFTALAPTKSEVIRTPQEEMAQARAAYDRQAERAKGKQERMAQMRLDAQNAAAQNFVDYFAANPDAGNISGSPFLYGTSDGLVTSVGDKNDFTNDRIFIPNALSSMGYTQDGSFVPTLDDAKAILGGAGGYNYTAYHPGDTAQQTVNRAFGGNLSDDATNWLVSQGLQGQDRTVGDIRAQGIAYGDKLPDSATPYSAWNGPDQVGLWNTLKDAGADWTSFNAPQQAQVGPSWGQVQGNLNNKFAQQDEANRNANLAYNNETLGGNYGGGVVNDDYTTPFAGSMNANPAWGVNNNGVTMPGSTQQWNTPGYGQPGGSLFGSYGGLGGLGGFGGNDDQSRGRRQGMDGPWGSSNAWSPS